MEKEKEIMLNLQHVKVEEFIGEISEKDYSKEVGNLIHRRAGDIALDDKARELYHNGEVSLTDSMLKIFASIINESGLVLFVKKGLLEHIEKMSNP